MDSVPDNHSHNPGETNKGDPDTGEERATDMADVEARPAPDLHPANGTDAVVDCWDDPPMTPTPPMTPPLHPHPTKPTHT